MCLATTCPSYLQPASWVHGIGRLGSENTQEEPSWRLVAKMSLGCLDCILAREIRSKTPTCQMVDLNACFSHVYCMKLLHHESSSRSHRGVDYLAAFRRRTGAWTLCRRVDLASGGRPVMAGGLEFHTFSLGLLIIRDLVSLRATNK